MNISETLVRRCNGYFGYYVGIHNDDIKLCAKPLWYLFPFAKFSYKIKLTLSGCPIKGSRSIYIDFTRHTIVIAFNDGSRQFLFGDTKHFLKQFLRENDIIRRYYLHCGVVKP